MARVLIPQNPRRYNFNPKGSSTAVVTMKGHNPFERRPGPEGLAPMTRRVRGSLAGVAGMSGLGDGPVLGPPSPAATDSGSTPINWAAIAQATATAIQPLATAEAARLLPKAPTIPIPGQTPTALPVGYTVVPKPASKMPWIVGGIGAVAALGVLFMVMRRKH